MNSLSIQSSSKTEEIMSRYRPIAPKPQIPMNPSLHGPPTPEKTHQPPFFTQLLQQKSSKYSKARRKGKSAIYKGSKTHFLTCGVASLAKNNTTQGFDHGLAQFPFEKPVKFVTLPFLPYPSSSSIPELRALNPYYYQSKEISNTETPQQEDHPSSSGCRTVITPQPVRLICSTISVKWIGEVHSSCPIACICKKPEEVEEEVESDALPAIVSDSNNKVRSANSAYKAMVGQPECPWLDSMAIYGGGQLGGSTACKRISGEVMLDLLDSRVPVSSNGFSCKVRIEWGSKGKKSSINAPCDVMKLSCESKNYTLKWRFHTSEISQDQSYESQKDERR